MALSILLELVQFLNALPDGRTVGSNLGAGWTDGTGMNENGLCVDGRLTKISEDVKFDYDREISGTLAFAHNRHGSVDLVFTPFMNAMQKPMLCWCALKYIK